MFELFTESARQTVVFAQDEARALRHNYIGTEHILLGLLREKRGPAAAALESLEISLEEVRAQVARVIGHGGEVTLGQIPFTPRAKKVLELALREARSLGHDYIGTEHVLLALVRENEGVAARILSDLGASARDVARTVLRELEPEVSEPALERFSTEPPAGRSESSAVQAGVAGETHWPPSTFFGRGLPLIAGALLFGIGLLVGWSIWG